MLYQTPAHVQKKVSEKIEEGNVTNIAGNVTNIGGNVTNIVGNVTNIANIVTNVTNIAIAWTIEYKEF